MTLKFTGFPAQSFQFLHNLREHNTKEWFQTHRQDYQQFIFQPMQDLVEDLAPLMLSIDPLVEVTPAVNKTIARIYRDIRFSKDKSPYRTTQWLAFKRPRQEWQNHPAYFFELLPESYRFGMGFYCADRNTMDRFRADLDNNPTPFLAATGFFNQGLFALEGESYKRPLKADIPPALHDWYNRKSFYLVNSQPVGEKGIPAAFSGELATAFEALAPFYQYLSSLIQP
ncbi:MAG TPA: DUF2461 domain-containing protein [Accumulibacter sp.]|nr:DUF2461 domain-containing protein [Accumulibacter sp.]HMW18751.1 DUF2461 domain-containing protein [Accumulibacter sp.]HMX22568.1 DUF2461 domain-containing protein [Accumulibacter sp.]HMY06097.1 DUF2461 domain-containing protein [Accumulibacter sp.]HNC18777.1 DUF2461 domain-containing protein [Accumulibacter sp.]